MIDWQDWQPGDIGLAVISGWVGHGVRIGQWLVLKLNDRNRIVRDPEWTHAFIYLGPTPQYPEGAVVEARPGGARVASVWEYTVRPVYRCKGIADTYVSRRLSKSFFIMEYAVACVGTPYSFLDYVAIALHAFRIPVPGLKTYIARTKHMICSQLVDHVYTDAGITLFIDDRWVGYVTPGDILELDQSLRNGA